jgi:Mrp family chromosome partitioning ATPase
VVERLKAAIEKAREKRSGEIAPTMSGVPAPTPDAWNALEELSLDEGLLLRKRIVTLRKLGPANASFDLLRTRLLKTCEAKGWRSIGIMSPTKGCGKTLVSVNLAFSLARHPLMRAVVIDIDLRAPAMGKVLGAPTDRRISDFFAGRVSVAEHFVRVGDRLAFGLNSRSERDSAEIMQGATTRAQLRGLQDALAPTIVLYDLPPLLAADDALGFLDNLDAVLIVAAAGETRPDQIEECSRLLDGAAPIFGVVLNKCVDEPTSSYDYDPKAT